MKLDEGFICSTYMKLTINTEENGTETTTVHLWRGLHPDVDELGKISRRNIEINCLGDQCNRYSAADFNFFPDDKSVTTTDKPKTTITKTTAAQKFFDDETTTTTTTTPTPEQCFVCDQDNANENGACWDVKNN